MQKKKALITGAARGIGCAIAEEFAKGGYDLILTCLNSKEKIEKLALDLANNYAVTCDTFIGDISDSDVVNKLFKNIEALDVLVNNAGISYVGLLSDMTYEEWHKVINTNLNSAFYCSKHAIPLMLKEKRGKIINISSVWGEHGASMEVAYSASKGGLNSFTKALARELGPSNIQVNAIACGMIDTDMNKCFSNEDIEGIISEIPLDRIGQPDEVAKLALQLCTGNNYLTGQIITLDGGWI